MNNNSDMFEVAKKRVEGNMFSESLLEEAKAIAFEMLETEETERVLMVGKEGKLLLTTEKEGHGSILASFPMDSTVFYIVLPYGERP